MTLLAHHSRAGGNPAKTNIPRSGQSPRVVSLREFSSEYLDSRLRGNDGIGGVK